MTTPNTFEMALDRDECYVVEAVLKESASERTELVTLDQGKVFGDGSHYQPVQLIRKWFAPGCGLGGAYSAMRRAGAKSRSFEHLPHILRCEDREEGRIVVMDYIAGETLDALVEREGPSTELALRLFPQLCAAVRELHEGFRNPIIHRDLKPSNVMVEHGTGTLYLIDFGIARVHKDDADTDTQHFGTRGYAPPEQFGFSQTDVRSDVYAMGVLLYFMLVGETPDEQVRANKFFHPQVPESFRQVISCACALDPAARFKDVAEMETAFTLFTRDLRESLAEDEAAGDKKRRRGRGRAKKRDAGDAPADAQAGLDGSAEQPAELQQHAKNEGGVELEQCAEGEQTAESDGESEPAGAAELPDHDSPRRVRLRRIARIVGWVWNLFIAFWLVMFTIASFDIGWDELVAGDLVGLAENLVALFLMLFPIGYAIRARNVWRRISLKGRYHILVEVLLCLALVVLGLLIFALLV